MYKQEKAVIEVQSTILKIADRVSHLQWETETEE